MRVVPFIRAEDVEARLAWPAMVAALAEGHHGPRPVLSDQFLHRGEDVLLSRAAWIDGAGIAVKSVSVLPGNPAQGRPSVQGALVLFDDGTGAVRAIIDSGLVTKWKTAADSVLGATLLARPESQALLILGAGVVAASLVEAYAALFPLTRIEIWNRNPARAEALAASLSPRYPVAAVSDLAAAVARADIISTATMARDPVLSGDWLRPGQHVDLIGAFTKAMREADDTALRRSRIFVDARATTLHHIGELSIPLAAGVITEADVLGDLGDLCTGAPGRVAEGDITLFKNGGGAHLDLMTARAILAAL